LILFKAHKQEVNRIVYSESGFSEKLQKMQIIRANHLHVEKESWKENLCGQQKEGGTKNIIKIGGHTKCPRCTKIGRIVWVSQDGKTAGLQCPASHSMISRPVSKFGSTLRPQSKTGKNMVFLMEIK
jgi:hypothetical protein